MKRTGIIAAVLVTMLAATAAHAGVMFFAGSIKGMRIGLSPDYFRIAFPDPKTGEYSLQPLPAENASKRRMNPAICF